MCALLCVTQSAAVGALMTAQGGRVEMAACRTSGTGSSGELCAARHAFYKEKTPKGTTLCADDAEHGGRVKGQLQNALARPVTRPGVAPQSDTGSCKVS
jgi:hypothetical protein